MDTILEAVKLHAESEKGALKTAIADRKGCLSYEELWRDTVLFASFMKSNFGDRGYAVISCTQNREFVLSVLGCQMAGIITVPVEKGATETGIKGIIEVLDKPVVFLGAKEIPGTAFLNIRGLIQLVHEGSPGERNAEISLPEAEDIAELLFSTGTTGKSKAIKIRHSNNRAIAENIINGVSMKEDNVEIIPMPLSHSHGLRTLYANLYNGSTAVLTNGVFMLQAFYQMMDEYQVTAIDMSPAILNVLFELSEERLGKYSGKIDYVELGSAPLLDNDKERLSKLLPDSRLYNFYGSTESGRTCTYDFSHEERAKNCIGKSTVNAEFIFADGEKNRVEATMENPGFIATKGGQNMAGYYGDEELTKSISKDGFIYTSDLGYMDEDRFIYCLGRADSVINRGGVKISPEEIEALVMKEPSVLDCALVPEKDPLQGQVPILYISIRNPDKGGYDEEGFAKFLKENIDPLKLPKRVEVIPEIPRAKNGKILRSQLIKEDK